MKYPRPPAEAQIEELLTTARNNLRVTVEMPFNESQEPYMLSSFVESAKSECFWMFYRGVGPDSSLLWNMMTDDPGLIHHLMTSQFPALETGFSSIPKSKEVARAVANYKDVKDAQLPADSEFEMTNTPSPQAYSAAQNFPKSTKPEHDLLTLPDEPAKAKNGPASNEAPMTSAPIPGAPPPVLPVFPHTPSMPNSSPGAGSASNQVAQAPVAPVFQQPAVPFPQTPGMASAVDVAQAAAHAAAQAAINAAVQAAAHAAAQAAAQAAMAHQPVAPMISQPAVATAPQPVSDQSVTPQATNTPAAEAQPSSSAAGQPAFSAPAPAQENTAEAPVVPQVPPILQPQAQQAAQQPPLPFAAPGANSNRQNLEPPPGYTPLNLAQGAPLAHTPQIPLSQVVPLSAQPPGSVASESPEIPSFLKSSPNAPAGAPAADAGPGAPGADTAPGAQTADAAPGAAAPNTPKAASRGTADKTLKLEANAHTAPGRGWLKDDKGTSMVVEPVLDSDSPFVQPKKSPRQTSQKMKARPMLEGDLTNLQMPTLLQSINMGKMTGRLDLQSGGELAVIYFKEGVPVHCQLRNSEGENAIIEAIGWDEGEFKFFMESPHHRETIKKRLDHLLMEGAALIDQSKFLKEIGVNLDSYLVRNHADITEQLFEEMVARGAAAEMNLQKMLYQLIDNESTLEDLLRLRPMPKPRWVPVIFNLVTCSLVSFSDRPLHEGGEEAVTEDIDWPAIQAFEDSIKIAETGFLTYPAFVYHLEREYERFERFQHPFTLIILEVSIKEELSETKDPKVLQDRAVLGQLSTRIEKLKRKTDIAGHFGENQFALLLLETEGEAGRNFASRLAEAIAMNPFTTDRVEVVRLTVSLGVASVPETCRDLGRLISLARPQNSQK